MKTVCTLFLFAALLGLPALAQDTDCASQPCSTRCDCEKRYCEQLNCSQIPPWNFIWARECAKACWNDYRNCQEDCTDGPPNASPTPTAAFLLADYDAAGEPDELYYCDGIYRINCETGCIRGWISCYDGTNKPVCDAKQQACYDICDATACYHVY